MRVFPGTHQNPNYGQETGSLAVLDSLTMASMSGNFHRRQPGCSGYRLAKSVLSFLLLSFAIFWICRAANGQVLAAAEPQMTEPHTTLVIFAGHRMGDRQWTALVSALRRNLAEAAEESHAIADNPEIVRGEDMQPGMRVETPIVVFLHGDCNLQPLVRRTAYGVRLGWVRMDHGQIEPFAHVDCTEIGQVLGQQAMGLDRNRRDAVMAGAIARVILHEWIHIATQSSAHADRGIEKAQFGVEDLMAGGDHAVARFPKPW